MDARIVGSNTNNPLSEIFHEIGCHHHLCSPSQQIRQKVQIRMLDTATNNHYVWNLVEIGGLNTPHSLSPTQSYTQSGDNGILDNEGTTAKPIILCPQMAILLKHLWNKEKRSLIIIKAGAVLHTNRLIAWTHFLRSIDSLEHISSFPNARAYYSPIFMTAELWKAVVVKLCIRLSQWEWGWVIRITDVAQSLCIGVTLDASQWYGIRFRLPSCWPKNLHAGLFRLQTPQQNCKLNRATVVTCVYSKVVMSVSPRDASNCLVS